MYGYRIKLTVTYLSEQSVQVFYWNRNEQLWADEEGGKLYPTARGGNIVLDKLFRKASYDPEERKEFTLYTAYN